MDHQIAPVSGRGNSRERCACSLQRPIGRSSCQSRRSVKNHFTERNSRCLSTTAATKLDRDSKTQARSPRPPPGENPPLSTSTGSGWESSGQPKASTLFPPPPPGSAGPQTLLAACWAGSKPAAQAASLPARFELLPGRHSGCSKRTSTRSPRSARCGGQRSTQQMQLRGQGGKARATSSDCLFAVAPTLKPQPSPQGPARRASDLRAVAATQAAPPSPKRKADKFPGPIQNRGCR